MGLTSQACGLGALRETFNLEAKADDRIVALAGNPNTGKSTLFNFLTGLNQHTGNWPGKTVVQAKGHFWFHGARFVLVDLPGTYSLLAKSPEEETARSFICFAQPDVTMVVVDATCLERNLNLVLQVLEITPRVVVCVNLMDEARRKRIFVDTDLLTAELGVPVLPITARTGEGVPRLLRTINDIANESLKPVPKIIRYEPQVEEALLLLEPLLAQVLGTGLSPRWVALRLLDGDESILAAIEQFHQTGITSELEVRLKHELKFSSV